MSQIDNMMQISRIIAKTWTYFLLGFSMTLLIAGCNIVQLRESAPPPSVEPVPTPTLPDWIESISPTEQAEPLAQIRIRFTDPLIPVEDLANPESQEVLQNFEVVPPLPGQFRFLTPRMVGFQADQAIPKATRFRVTLKAGLADLSDHQLDQDFVWTFKTEPIQLTNMPGTSEFPESELPPVELQPTLNVTSNVELNLRSLREHVRLIPDSGEDSVRLTVESADDFDPESQEVRTTPQERFDPSARQWVYQIAPQQPLAKATRYTLEFAPGISPAGGNLASEMAFTSQVETYGPLSFEGVELVDPSSAGGAYGRFVKGRPQLAFNNGLVADSATENISVDPPPKDTPPLVRAYEGDRLVSLNPWALEPATAYTITLGADLEDQYGQTLGEPMTVRYETGDLAGDLWAPDGLNIFPAGQNLQINLSAVNLPENQYKAAYRVVQPSDLVYADSAYPRNQGTDLLPAPTNWQTLPVELPTNEPTEIAVPLRDRLNGNTGMLAYGVQARTGQYSVDGRQEWREPTFYGLVQLTNLGVFAQWFPESGVVRVQHLSDGSSVGNARIELYESRLDAETRTATSPCFTGQTDQSGMLTLGAPDLRQCMNGNAQFADAPDLLVIAREGQDWAFARTFQYSGAWGYGVNGGWNSSQPESRGTIFSDRNLYQPGETAYFTGAAYFLQNGLLQQDPNVSYTVMLDDPNGNTIELGTQTTNQFGTFSLEWAIAPEQPLGFYTIRAKADGGGDNGKEITGEFRIAEFKPPNFKVDLVLDQQVAVSGDEITAAAQSNYLFGPPVEGGEVSYYVTRQQTQFTPEAWNQFSFGRQWFWPEEAPSVSSDVLQRSESLSDDGSDEVTVEVAEDLPYPMTYRVDAEVSDVSNLSVTASQTFTALPGDRLIGLQSDFVAEVNEEFPVEVIVTDPDGNAVSGQRVQVELQKMNYSGVTQVIAGSSTARNQVEYETVAEATVRSGSEPQSVTLTPSESGSYRIRANFANADDEVTATDTQIWVTGNTPVYWGGRYTNNRLELKLNKDRYQLGETATVLIQSPYEEAELYFAIVRHDVIYQTVTTVQGGAPQIQFEVTPDMLPNAAVEAVLVRKGEPLSEVEVGTVEDLARIGFAPFETSLDSTYLDLQVNLAEESLEPGGEQSVNFNLTDRDGQPVQGQITVMAVNEAVLQLSDYRVPDLVETVYAEQPISVRFADNRPEVVLTPLSSPLEKGWGYGGGLSTGTGDTRIRTEFKAIAYYNGSVLTDANGRASVNFTLPDDLTTWRVMAIATDGNLRFANSTDTTFISTKPLVTNPILPQFARPGDRIEAGLSVTNNTGESGTLSLTGTASGALQLADDASASLETRVESGTQAYRFPMVVTGSDEGTIQFTSQLGQFSDAFEFPLEIRVNQITEQVVETGTTSSQAQILFNITENVPQDTGGIALTLASTLIPEISAPAQQVLNQEQLPFLEPAASQLAIATSLQSLSQTLGQSFAEFEPTQQANQALRRLRELQRPDGGFASYPAQEQSDPYVTPYAAEAIARAAETFSDTPAAPDAELVSQLRRYLQDILANPSQYDYCKQQLCQNQVRLRSLTALAAFGDIRNSFIADIYGQRSQFDPLTQIKLARHLAQLPDWQSQANELANELQETVYQTSRSATVNLPRTWQWISSPTAVQSQALRLFIARDSAPELIDRLVRGLLDQRRDGIWPSTYDNAEALLALVNYSQLQPTPPDFSATAQLNDQPFLSAEFEGYSTPSTAESIPMADLQRGRNRLSLQKTGDGLLHYLAAYRYRLEGDQPGRLSGLRVTRTIRPANQDEILKEYDLYVVDDPLSLPPGQVYDIGLEIITDHSVDHVIITDPLPAGFEAVDESFQTANPYFQARSDSWQVGYQTIYKDRIVAYGDRLDPGVYSLHYLVRSVTPGTYHYPGAEAHLEYAPEEFGRSASSTLRVVE
ncbi:MAG: alpha-2-macroglobulin family protein [Elainellaceae cyanobacterium]